MIIFKLLLIAALVLPLGLLGRKLISNIMDELIGRNKGDGKGDIR